MKIQSVKSNIAFERKIDIEPVKEDILRRFDSKKNGNGDLFINKLTQAVEGIPGEETYQIASGKISGDLRRVTLNGIYDGIHDISITVNSLASVEKIRSSFARYAKK